MRSASSDSSIFCMKLPVRWSGWCRRSKMLAERRPLVKRWVPFAIFYNPSSYSLGTITSSALITNDKWRFRPSYQIESVVCPTYPFSNPTSTTAKRLVGCTVSTMNWYCWAFLITSRLAAVKSDSINSLPEEYLYRGIGQPNCQATIKVEVFQEAGALIEYPPQSSSEDASLSQENWLNREPQVNAHDQEWLLI